MKEFIKKMVKGTGILLVMTAVILGIITLRFAVYAPEILSGIFAR